MVPASVLCTIGHSRFLLVWHLYELLLHLRGKQLVVKKQRRRGRRRREGVIVVVEGVGDAGGGPKAVAEGVLHLLRDEWRAAERAGALVMLHPAVEAPAVEDVSAVGQPPHLLRRLEFVEAHRAVVPQVLPLPRQLLVPDHRQDLLDQHRRRRPEFRAVVLAVAVGGRGVGPGDVRVEEVAEADGGENRGDEAPDEAEEEDRVE